MNKICGYTCEHNEGGVCQLTYCNKIGKMTTTTINDNREITIYKGSVDTSMGKIIINDIEITDTESWNKAINTLDEKDKEIERLNKEKDDLDDYNRHLHNENKRLNNIIEEVANDILKELEENNHLSYGVALSMRHKLLDYKELKEGK